MDFRIDFASVAVGLLIWVMVGWAMKRAKLYPSYAVLWVMLGGLFVLLPLYADLLRWAAANIFGIVGGNNLVFALLLSAILVYLLFLTQKLCELTNRVERIIVALAILEARTDPSVSRHDS